MSFGEKVRQRRMEKGMKQAELAEKIDSTLKRQTISKWENEPSAYPKVDHLLSMSVILDVSLDELFADEIAYLKQNTTDNSLSEKYPGLIVGMKAFATAFEKMGL